MLETSCWNRWIVFLYDVLCPCLNISAILLIFVALKQIQKTRLLCSIPDRYPGCLLASSNHGLEQIRGYIHSFFSLTLQGRGPNSAQLQSSIQHFLQQLYPSFFLWMANNTCYHIPQPLSSPPALWFLFKWQNFKKSCTFPSHDTYFIQGDDCMSILSHKLQGQEVTNWNFYTVLSLPSDYFLGGNCIWPLTFIFIYLLYFSFWFMVYFSLYGINLMSFPSQ